MSSVKRRTTTRTFAEVLAEAKDDVSTTPEAEVCPGGYNTAGDLFDPVGNVLVRIGTVTPKEAQRRIRDGARLAWETCGCGGWTGCEPIWIPDDVRNKLSVAPKPRFVPKHGVEPWIDLWQGNGGPVVYAHGDVKWANALA